MKVRTKLPVRRNIPSNNPTGKNWSEHKQDLKEDFHHHCGYCGSLDDLRHTYYEVDHFVPKSLFEKSGNISYCQYNNLVYSCKFCNNIKLNKWPSNDEKISHLNDEGFIDPCMAEYDSHIYRTDSGSIRWHTNLGKWMVEKGFKFDERDYSVKLLWEMDKLNDAMNILIKESTKYDSNSDKHKEILQKAHEAAFQYFLFNRELMNYYNAL